jgi:kynureninase
VWCSYKYLNAGPGAIAGLYVHERHDGRDRLAGWWGHNEATRFAMPPTFDAMPGAAGFQVSNPCVLSTVALLGSLSVFAEAGGDMVRLRKRSDLLTGFLDTLLRASSFFVPVASASAADDRPRFTIITPPAPDRGAQLSLLFLPSETGLMERVAQSLIEDGIVGDERKPDVIRLAPAPLYTTFDDVRQAAGALERAMRTVHSDAL